MWALAIGSSVNFSSSEYCGDDWESCDLRDRCCWISDVRQNFMALTPRNPPPLSVVEPWPKWGVSAWFNEPGALCLNRWISLMLKNWVIAYVFFIKVADSYHWDPCSHDCRGFVLMNPAFSSRSLLWIFEFGLHFLVRSLGMVEH